MNVVGDCSITPDESTGFVTNFDNEVWVVDLTTTPPTLDPIPIPISNPGEDTSITPDGKFLVVCDGNVTLARCRSSISLPGSRSAPSTWAPIALRSMSAVMGPCSSIRQSAVRRLTIDGAGTLTDTLEVLPVFTPINVFCAPGGGSGVVVERSPVARSSHSRSPV